MNTLYVRCQTKDYILDIVAARAGMRINKVNSNSEYLWCHIKQRLRSSTSIKFIGINSVMINFLTAHLRTGVFHQKILYHNAVIPYYGSNLSIVVPL